MPLNNPPPIQNAISTQSGLVSQVWALWFIKVATDIDGGAP